MKLNKVGSTAENEIEEEYEVYNLLAGVTDKDGVLHSTFTVRDMTGRDEEALSSMNHRGNMAKVAQALLERCVTAVGTLTRKDLGSEEWSNLFRAMFVGDLDYIFFVIKSNNVGKKIIVEHDCPFCASSLKSEFEAEEIKINPYKGVSSIPFELSKGYTDSKGVCHTKGTLRLPKGLDREIVLPVAKKNVAQGTSLLLSRLCTFEDGTHITPDVMASLTVRDRKYLETLLQDNSFGVDSAVEVVCSECGKEFKGNLSNSNFV